MDLELLFLIIRESTILILFLLIGLLVEHLRQSIEATEAMLDDYIHGADYYRDYDMGDAEEVIPPRRPY